MLTALADPCRARAVLQHFLGCRISELKVLDTAMRDGGAVQYQATCVEGGGHSSDLRLTALSFQGAALEKAAARVRKQAARRRPDLARWIAVQPDLELLVAPFPLDPSLDHLPVAADAAAFSAWVRKNAPDLVSYAAEDCRARMLRYVPGRRCTLHYGRTGTGGQPAAWAAKVFREGRAGRAAEFTACVSDVFRAHGDPSLTAPRCLAWLPELSLLLQEWMPGVRLYDLIHQAAANKTHFLGAARTIALLHGSGLELRSRFAVEEELALVAAVAPAGCGRYPEVLHGIRERAADLPPGRLVPVHRDFYDKQLLMDGPRTALIDLDTLALGHAEIDLANFTAHLQLRALQGAMPLEQACHWQSAFLVEYEHRARQPIDPRLLDFFLASAFFRLACLYGQRTSGARFAPFLLELAGEAAGCQKRSVAPGVRR